MDNIATPMWKTPQEQFEARILKNLHGKLRRDDGGELVIYTDVYGENRYNGFPLDIRMFYDKDFHVDHLFRRKSPLQLPFLRYADEHFGERERGFGILASRGIGDRHRASSDFGARILFVSALTFPALANYGLFSRYLHLDRLAYDSSISLPSLYGVWWDEFVALCKQEFYE